MCCGIAEGAGGGLERDERHAGDVALLGLGLDGARAERDDLGGRGLGLAGLERPRPALFCSSREAPTFSIALVALPVRM